MRTLLLSVLLVAPACKSAAPRGLTFPAEFEPHESIWMAWPSYENKAGVPTEPLIVELIGLMEGHVAVDLIINEGDEANVLAALSAAGVPRNHLTIHEVPHGDVWMRDMGPIFGIGADGRLGIVDFGFNTWGYEETTSENSRLEEAVDRRIAERLGLPTVRTELVSEGGNREVNGAGVMIACEAVELQRNPGWTRDEIERELLTMLGQEKLIWIPEGMAEDELTFRGRLPGGVYTTITTGGHVDEFVRFCGPRTILLAEISAEEATRDPIAAISRPRLEEARRILEAETTVDGEPFEIVRIPTPDSLFETLRAGDGVFDYIQPLEYEDGSVIAPDDEVRVVWASSYLNFIITNGLVIMQTYWKPGRPESLREKDAEAKRVLSSVFPGREIVGVDAEAVNLGGGGIHCITQQMPAVQ
ncbi:MAG: agmatine deiminase family protein [Planctomycetota bacterium]